MKHQINERKEESKHLTDEINQISKGEYYTVYLIGLRRASRALLANPVFYQKNTESVAVTYFISSISADLSIDSLIFWHVENFELFKNITIFFPNRSGKSTDIMFMKKKMKN